MTRNATILAAIVGLSLLAATPLAQSQSPQVEYIDIRWDGVDRMCIVYPDGRVEFLADQLKPIPRPDEANKRAFYMTIAMGRMAAKGYELAGFISDEIIMKRTLR